MEERLLEVVVYGAGMLRVQEMTEADIDAVSAIRVRGWQAAYAGIVPQPYLDGMTVEDDARERRSWFRRSPDRVLNLVAIDDHAGTVGWACLGPCRGEVPPGTGEVYALYIRPDLTGNGIGTVLINALHSRATGQQFDTLMLWVLQDNLRARRFYESLGYTADGATQSDTYGDTLLSEMRYRRTLL
ncbi:GNAT family N-acetyltransferase [Streptomyces sp. 769]|uniref:GNAT family N-acetyltransferase n=1 Tax=Streptomyces sp. 769 TaxID=1262452 RepID=UPI000581FAE8|nr:GNAT family N-acetyltransferase [Streptomyces sp. 769]AJC54950.1 Acetyltransferase [Streptomyces sp. 769]